MRIARLPLVAAAAVTLAVVPVYAQGRGHANPPVTQHGNPHTTTTTTSSSPKTTTTSTGTTSTGSTSTGSTSTGTTSTGSTSTGTTTAPNPIAAKISSHPNLAAKCTSLLPQGMTLNQASSGFRNQGQFIAALHVSKNLNIPFAQLKAAMLGTSTAPNTPGTLGTSATSSTSGTGTLSLGHAIHKLRPTIDADGAATHATTQATNDLSSTSTSSSTTTATSTHK